MFRIELTHLLLAGMIALVPVPKQKEVEQFPVGVWEMQWGVCRQVTTFRDDGTCSSPQFGKGTWRFEDGAVYFGERDDAAQYVMSVEDGVGSGASVCGDGSFSAYVMVTIKRKVQ